MPWAPSLRAKVDSGDAVLCKLGRAIQANLPQPAEADAKPEGALCELLLCRDVYSLDVESITAPYDADKLRVRKGDLARELFGEDPRRFLDSPDELFVLPLEDFAAVRNPICPLCDKRLKDNSSLRRDFIRQLDRVGLIAWRPRARCVNCGFSVKKNDVRIRLVLDCRPVNQLHRQPSRSRWAIPSALASLVLSDEWVVLWVEALQHED
jgi:hypothetical protein